MEGSFNQMLAGRRAGWLGKTLPRDAEELPVAGQIDGEREAVADVGEVGREDGPRAQVEGGFESIVQAGIPEPAQLDLLVRQCKFHGEWSEQCGFQLPPQFKQIDRWFLRV